jgi:hypothetical protein
MLRAIHRLALRQTEGLVSSITQLLVDSSSVKLYRSGEWLVAKHGTQYRRAWRKHHRHGPLD